MLVIYIYIYIYRYIICGSLQRGTTLPPVLPLYVLPLYMQRVLLLRLTVCSILIDAVKKLLSAGPSKRLDHEMHEPHVASCIM